MKRIIILLFLFPSFLLAQTDIVWDFASDSQDWTGLGGDRDVSVVWNNGALEMNYIDGGNGSSQLWFPQIRVENISYNSTDHIYLEIDYEAVNWPTTDPVTVLLSLNESSATRGTFSLDPGKNTVTIAIASAINEAGVYDGTYDLIQLELPRSLAAYTASDWFGASTRITKIQLLKEAGEDVPEPPVSDTSFLWTFDADLDGWYTSDGVDVDLTWEESAMVMNYVDHAEQGAQVWFPQIYRNTTINAADYKYCNIFYEAVDWPVSDPVLALLFLDKADGKRTYSNLNFDPAAEYLSIDINKLYNASWSQTDYSGEFKKVGFELPHNSVATPGSDWYGIAQLKISKIEFSNTFIEPPVTDSITAYWSFDNDFIDSVSQIEGVSTGTPGISSSEEALVGDGALLLGDGDYLTMPENEVYSRENVALMLWAKTEKNSLGEGEKASILSFKDADIFLSLTDGKLIFTDTRITDTLANWEDDAWNHIALYIGSDNQLTCTFNGLDCNASIGTKLSDRQNDLVVGSDKLSAIIDELSIYNYHPIVSRTTIDQLRKTPPSVSDTIPAYSESWDTILEENALLKSGLTRLKNSRFMHQPIGLGGTVLRADPWGFAYNKAPMATTLPYYGYEYWWDNEGHRLNAFNVRGGYDYYSTRYGDLYEPGNITAFEQNLDITRGILETNLSLSLDDTDFTSSRETFVTPGGILVIRVKDSGAPYPLQLGIEVNKDINWGGTYYQGDEEQYARDDVHSVIKSIEGTPAGAVLVATRTNSATAALAVAVEASSGTLTFADDKFGSTDKDATLTFYIAPASSFNPATPSSPWDRAWSEAKNAMQTGFAALKQQTESWWSEYMNVSSVLVPDKEISKLYAQSLFYHGVYFGNTNIPPGCFGTDVNGFFGGICPEYDLTFSSFAMAYTGHINETKNIAQWVVDVLPKAKKQATEGVTHHDVSRQYPTFASGDSGAIYTTIMGYDGALTIQGEPFEGINLLQNYPGLNSARMALNYLDYSDDQAFAEGAHDVLRATTYVALEDLIYDNGKDGYRDGKIPNSMQQAAAQMGFNECKKRGVAEPEWLDTYDGKILYSEGLLSDEPVLSGAVGYNPAIGEGSATSFFALWWATVIDKHDERAVMAVDNYHETFQPYVFNNGWTGVHNAKVYRGNDALMWLRNFERTDVLIDETVFTENSDAIWTTPEIGAHGVYICNLSQMLIDPDNDTVVDVFPAVPDEWEYKRIGFENLMTSGALSFTATRDINGTNIRIENKANTERTRKIRIKIPDFVEVVGAESLVIADGFIEEEVTIAAGDTKTLDYSFDVELIGTGTGEVIIELDSEKSINIYPNPNGTGRVHLANVNSIDRVNIYSLNGKLVLTSMASGNTIDISPLNVGMYVIRVSADNHVHSKILIVE